MTLNDVIWPAILDFPIFLNSQEITEINTKSSHNAYKMYKFMNCHNLTKKTGKKPAELYQKSWFLAISIWNLMVAMAASKMMDMQMRFQNFYREW